MLRCLSSRTAAMVSDSQCQFLTWVRKASRSKKHHDQHNTAFQLKKDFNLSSSSISSGYTDRPPSLDRPQHGSPARLSLASLLADDPAEANRLLLACQDLGGFYLDLRSTELGERVMADADRLFRLGGDIFDLTEPEKREYDMAKFGGYYGYKGYRNRTLDTKEFYTVSKDDILDLPCPSTTCRPQPQPINSSRPLIKTYIQNSHAIISLVLSRLTSILNLPRGSLENIHRRDANSGDQIRWIKLQASKESRPLPEDDVLLDEHSDSNSVTLLFNRSGGLQFRSPQPEPPSHSAIIPKDNPISSSSPALNTTDFPQGPSTVTARWTPANPIPGHCIILMGEQLVKLTEGAVRANVHRVCALPGLQGTSPRYSLVYFSRPEDDVILKQLAGVPVVPKPVTTPKGVRERQSQCKRISKVFEGKEWMGWARAASPRLEQKR
ncbi:uncharacterized protein GIQ15_00303 [Arthroderma uncinatum]|uniref:uncharacterized protein n=1 Tax=Arthroderma uncinatum TaxID=74035 RepID=UPI00144ADF3E|nr:uncharacterized protein GIQ15_00303 [Arthroderma uncinatum]KAF3490786.1 hypothetical protein GIQ15_00303 [Arthroderma uncinatum]